MDGVIDENGKPTQAFKSTVDIIGMARFFDTMKTGDGAEVIELNGTK